MRDRSTFSGSATTALWIALAAAWVAVPGCHRSSEPNAAPPAAVAGQPEPDQRVFDSAEDAAKALVQAAADNDTQAVGSIFGPKARQELLSGDPVEDRRGLEILSTHAKEQWRVEGGDNATTLYIGERDWPCPIPLRKAPDGKWFFDTAAGTAEILARRIGRNELETIKTCRAFLEIEREYAREDRTGSGVLQYARRFHSRPGAKDGLYWETPEGEEPSPMGPLIAAADLKGYDLEQRGALRQTPYRGYLFHILTRQGPDAPGGKYDYVINGNMIAGFALVACPSKYRSTGVMTFMISHQGTLYQKDLGPDTLDAVERMTEFNPDSTWQAVKD